MPNKINKFYNLILSCFITIIFSQNIFADTYIWSHADENGALISGNFETAGNWRLSNGEVATVPPGVNDDVVIPNSTAAYTVTVKEAFIINSLEVGNTEGSATSTVVFSNGVTTNEVKGAVIVGAKGILTHTANTTPTKQYKLCLKSAEMTIVKDGKVHGDEKGPYGSKADFWNKQTMGFKYGATYGGVGGENKDNLLSGKNCYGSIRAPMDLGSSGSNVNTDGYQPGGAVYLEVAGVIEVNGTISVFSRGKAYKNGSGGSIFIKAGSLQGTGVIDASSAKVTSSQGAGGGRISIRLSNATSFDSYKGDINAFGSYANANKKEMAGCGTIYQEHSGDLPGEGTLIIDNGPTGKPIGDNAVALFNSAVKDRGEVFGAVMLKRKGILRLPSGATLRIKNLLDTKNGQLICDDGSKVEFVGEGDAVIEGKNSFYSLECSVPGKKLIFGTGSSNRTTIKANGYLTLAGTEDSPIQIASAVEGTQCEFVISSGVTQNNSDANLKDLNASFGSSTLSVQGGEGINVAGCSISAKPKPGDVIIWNGSISSDWTASDNWDRQRAPIETDVVIIPSECQNYPLIKTDITVNTLSNLVGGSISFSGANLTVTNAFANYGAFNLGIDDVLKFSGTGEQLVDLGNMSYRRITIDKTVGSINFTNGFSADHFIARTTTPLSLFFAEGSVVDVDHLVLYGLAGESGAYNNLLTIGSTGTWYLKATDCHHIRGVNLSNCNASKGQKVKLGVFSNNVSGNDLESCDFSESATSEWIGGGSDFDSSSSWANGIVPADNTQICICPPKGVSYTLSTSRELSTGAIIIGGEGGTVSFTSNYKNAIEGGCYILSGATASFGFYAQPNTVAGDFMLGRNATLTHNVTDSGSLEKYKLNFLVSGNATIEQGGIVNIENKGFGGKSSGPGRTTSLINNGKATVGSAYAGMGAHYVNKPYGSILHPFSLGSAGYDTDDAHGGGAIKLIASGDVVINGTINAKGTASAYDPGTGGSIWISGASVSGKGKLSVRSESSGADFKWKSSAGRIAVYQTENIGWDDFSLTIDTAGHSSGTYYREDASGNGELFIEQAQVNSASAQVYVPMSSDSLSDYKKVSLTVAGGNTVAITNGTWPIGSRLTLRDLNLMASNARVYLKSSILKLLSRDHRQGSGWIGGDYSERKTVGTISLRDNTANEPGEIIWNEGFFITIR
jgi:hypothetical protein